MPALHDIRYVRIGTDDLDESVRFAVTVLGLELVSRERSAAYLRGDTRDHNICYVDGRSAGHVLGFEAPSLGAMDAVAAELEYSGITVKLGTHEQCEQRRVGGFINFSDPTGNSIDLVVRPSTSGRRYFPSRDAGITSFSHVGLRTTNPRVDERFWTGMLGARVSDWIGEAPLLRIDEVHHKIALFPSGYPGVQHVNFQVESIDDLMRSWYFLQSQNVRIMFGPGRHPTSGAMFLYFQGPDNVIYEYSTGVRMISAEEDRVHVPRQFPMQTTSFCMWGAKPDIAEFKTGPAEAYMV